MYTVHDLGNKALLELRRHLFGGLVQFFAKINNFYEISTNISHKGTVVY